MPPQVFDVVSRRAAAAVPRRRSLLLLGGAGATAALAGFSRDAVGKKSRTKNKKRCEREKRECRVAVEEHCGVVSSCLLALLPCCDTCKAGHGVICVLSLT